MIKVMATKQTAIIVLAIAAAGAIGWYLYRNPIFQVPDTAAPYPKPAESPAGDRAASGPTLGVEGSGTYRVEAVPIPSSGVGYPPLRRPISFSAAFSAEARALMRQKFEASSAALEKNPSDFNEWMNLAILRKTADDYAGAAEIWEFLVTTNPEQLGPFINLANLYAFELKNPALAEKYFSIALQKGSKEASVYRNGYDFYRYVQKDDEKAKETLKTGIAQTGSSDLQYLLDHYGEL